MEKVKLNSFSNKSFDKETTIFKWFTWMIISSFLFKPSWIPFMGLKVKLLRFFGAQIGKGLVIKPSVNIKFPWKLNVGNDVWLGENVWIDNLEYVTIGSNVCISQGALLLTGNHDYKLSSFDYLNKPIVIEDGVWIGARSVVCPGVKCESHSILAVASIATKTLEAYKIYQGNPAKEVRKRKIKK